MTKQHSYNADNSYKILHNKLMDKLVEEEGKNIRNGSVTDDIVTVLANAYHIEQERVSFKKACEHNESYIQDLMEQNDKLLQRISKLEAACKQYQTSHEKYSETCNELASANSRISTLERDLATEMNESNDFKEKIIGLEEYNSNLLIQQRIDAEIISKLKEELEQLEKDYKKLANDYADEVRE